MHCSNAILARQKKMSAMPFLATSVAAPAMLSRYRLSCGPLQPCEEKQLNRSAVLIHMRTSGHGTLGALPWSMPSMAGAALLRGVTPAVEGLAKMRLVVVPQHLSRPVFPPN